MRVFAILSLLILINCGQQAQQAGNEGFSETKPSPALKRIDRALAAYQLELPKDVKEQIVARLEARDRVYVDQYFARGVDWEGNPGQPVYQQTPGQLLSSITADPAFKDRSLGALILNWEPYLRNDLRVHSDGVSYRDPVTYYREWQAWQETGAEPGKEPQPIPFLLFPGHPVMPPPNPENPELPRYFPDLIRLMLRIDEIPKKQERLEAMHQLMTWLKGAPVPDDFEILGIKVPRLQSSTFSGMGYSFQPVIAFPKPREGELPEPSMKTAVADLFAKLFATNPDYSKIYEATFNPKKPEDYDAFVASAPLGACYEALAYTDDPLLMTYEGLEVSTQQGKNMVRTEDGLKPTIEAATVMLFFTHMVSAQRDPETGLPQLNGKRHRPASGLPLEEAAYFLHLSMIHTLDGWGVAALADSENPIKSLLYQFGEKDGIKDTWNQNHGDPSKTCGIVARLPELRIGIGHGEFYDTHIFIPHGRIDLVQARYEQLIQAGEPQTPEEWARLGYKWVPPDQITDPKQREESYRLLTLDELGEAGETILAQAFYAPYTGPFSRLGSNMAEAHHRENDLVYQSFHDPISESVVDTNELAIYCRQSIDSVVIECEACRYAEIDFTPHPNNPYTGRSLVVGETAAFLWNYTWTTGSHYPLHTGPYELPNYWSNPEDGAGEQLAGLVSFHQDGVPNSSFPRDPKNDQFGTEWFYNDTYGYFDTEAPEYLVNSILDIKSVTRAGRGDALYLLQYNPKGMMKEGSTLPMPSFFPESDQPHECNCTD